MKTELAILSFILFLIPLHFSSAYISSTFDLGGKYNPIYIKEVYDPYKALMDSYKQQRNADDQKEENLKMQYGIAAYSECSSTINWDKLNLADPYAFGSALNSIKYCLERKAIVKSSPTVSNDQYCINNFGQYSYYGKTDSKGILCGCKDGYKFNQESTQCVAKTENDKKLSELYKIYDQGCKNLSGINSYYSGETDINKNGGMGGCGCKTGYKFTNGNYGECVSVNTTTTSVVSQSISGGDGGNSDSKNEAALTKTNNQLCGETFTNSTWKGNKNTQGGLECDCDTGYQWNKDQTSCVLTSNVIQIVSSGGGGGNSGSRISNKDEIIPDIKVLESDVKKVDKKGTLIKPTALRKCPSTTCEIIRYYAETSELNIIEENKSGEWYKIKTENNTGWVTSISFDKNSIVDKNLPKIDLATSTVSKIENSGPKGFWQTFKKWFGF